jgi:hypothetical protein
MTAPAATPVDISAQILLKLGEMSAQLAVMDERLKDLPDHETRIRILENAKARLYGGAIAVSTLVSAAGTWIGFVISRGH